MLSYYDVGNTTKNKWAIKGGREKWTIEGGRERSTIEGGRQETK